MIYSGSNGSEALDGIRTEDGFIDCSGGVSNAQMQYFLRDHLGSVRVVASDRNTVLSRTDYLPFGSRMTGNGLPEIATARSVWFGFSGKENEKWDAASGTQHWLRGERWQHFGARAYDPATCIWTGIDPLAEKYPGVSPYAYCAGNPVNLVDSLGKSIGFPVKAFKVAKRVLKTSGTVKRVSTAALLTAEVYGYYDDIITLTNSESSTSEKAVATVDLLTGFGSEFKSGVQLLGIQSFAQGKLRSFTRNNFRHNLGQLTGGIQEGMEAHHILPQQFEKEFTNSGINIHDPKYGAWLDSYGHHKTHKDYNNAWKAFFKENNKPTIEQIENYAQQLMAQFYGYNYTPTL